ncbi:Protein BYPASS-related protein [Melia azedarach]|uniref:Protein BYPASS-related protein n=1 Tax=Melia azedarach TaxID=155640 RepID=A0ACC1XKN7_MELAZ|nr:Protein BYPASS-related protein [Melia azedarach]
MPATDYQGSFLGRISIRRNQVMSMEGNHEQEIEDLEMFQKHVADRFADLLSPQPSEEAPAQTLCSISWIRKLLDVFLCCDAEFKAILIMGRDPSQIIKPPLDRLIPELLDRAVKALDICNAITNGIEAVKHYQKLAEIAVTALEQRPFGDGQVKRAKKALNSLIAAMSCEDKDGNNYTRTWSFGRRGAAATSTKCTGQLRSLSWSVGRNWSATKQIHAMSANLVAPRGAESSGLALQVYIMSTILVSVMWAMVATIPCQERTGLATHFPVPKQLSWAHSMIALHEKIGEEWKKKEKKGSAGLLEEMQKLEKLGQSLIEFTDNFQFPAEDERAEEVTAQVAEMAETCRRMEEGLVPLQMQIREVFHRIVRSRAEFLDALDSTGKVSATAI